MFFGSLAAWPRTVLTLLLRTDIAAVSVEQARSRWQGLRGKRFPAEFYTLDCFEVSVSLCSSARVSAVPTILSRAGFDRRGPLAGACHQAVRRRLDAVLHALRL